MHGITSLTIANYRSIKEACELTIEGFTPLVGYNNAGKSNILSAIRWFAEGGSLKEADFNDPDQPVVVTGTVGGLTDAVLGLLEARHTRRIEPYRTAETITFRRTQAVPNAGVRGVTLEIRNPAVEADAENAWVVNPTGIDAAISALFPEPICIGAMEDAAEDVGKSKNTTTIGKLLSKIVDPIEQEHGARIREALQELESRLSATGNQRAPELTRVDEEASALVEEFFTGVRLAVHIPTPELKEVFKGGTIKVFEGGDIEGRDVSALGHGAQRSIQMALIRYLAEVSRPRGEVSRTILLIDEPELYLHPQAVEQARASLKVLSENGFQVVFSTHSPQMIKAVDLGSTLIIRKEHPRGTYSLPTLRDVIAARIDGARSQARTLFEFSNSAQILFSDRVILAEGPTEIRLLPELFERRYGATLAQRRMALISLGGVYNTAKALSILEAVGIPAKALVDLDFAYRGAVKAGYISEDNEHIEASREMCSLVAQEHGFETDDDGFPRKGGGFTAADGFALFARDERAHRHIDSLHEDLRRQKIWIWPRGSVEQHLGMNGKGEDVWFEYAERLKTEGCESVVNDLACLDRFFEWCQS